MSSSSTTTTVFYFSIRSIRTKFLFGKESTTATRNWETTAQTKRLLVVCHTVNVIEGYKQTQEDYPYCRKCTGNALRFTHICEYNAWCRCRQKGGRGRGSNCSGGSGHVHHHGSGVDGHVNIVTCHGESHRICYFYMTSMNRWTLSTRKKLRGGYGHAANKDESDLSNSPSAHG